MRMLNFCKMFEESCKMSKKKQSPIGKPDERDRKRDRAGAAGINYSFLSRSAPEKEVVLTVGEFISKPGGQHMAKKRPGNREEQEDAGNIGQKPGREQQ